MGDDGKRTSLFDFIINRRHKNFQMLYEFLLKDFLNSELIFLASERNYTLLMQELLSPTPHRL